MKAPVRVWAYAVSLVMAALVAWPAFRDPPQDSFPLSDFPMFSQERETPMMTIVQALGVQPDGERTPLPPIISSGNREVLQSMMTIGRGIHVDAPGFCAEVAARVAGSDDDDLSAVTHVELATSTFDSVRYFAEDPSPTERVVHASCEVPR